MHHRITGDPGSGMTTFARAVAEKTGSRDVLNGRVFAPLRRWAQALVVRP